MTAITTMKPVSATEAQDKNMRLVLVTEGESNGYDDSDGFEIYYDFTTNRVYRYNWSTRYPSNPTPKHIQWDDLTNEERQFVIQQLEDWAYGALKDQADDNQNHINTDIDWNVNLRDGLHVKVTGGRKYRGEGQLVKLETNYFYYNKWNPHSCAKTVNAYIKTDDGNIEKVNAKYVEVIFLVGQLLEAASWYYMDILREYGFNTNIVRYGPNWNAAYFLIRAFTKH